MSTSVLKALPDKLDIKRLSPRILYLSLHMDRVVSQSWNYDVMVLSDLVIGGLKSGVWINEYNYQNKDKT